MSSRFTEEQMVRILLEADATVDVAHKYGVRPQTIDAWRERFWSLKAADIKVLERIADENRRLKQILARHGLASEP